ncbi:uncharacterized protein BJ171DRAFT_137258 [Polychytrium aggregatum]|uniref:uncharacterized protein n=1 Tax=Polychytrium aggregatum TaxID=110093 RepID=UPI0022FF2A7A|nr:uncharacterized protein BJ171DRAFT_137258 [Polychytrium aggregatum]KAI9203597.1 hypothetical protein BJ171DRAFT_137258 [Polychytrium aggregatum]
MASLHSLRCTRTLSSLLRSSASGLRSVSTKSPFAAVSQSHLAASIRPYSSIEGGRLPLHRLRALLVARKNLGVKGKNATGTSGKEGSGSNLGDKLTTAAQLILVATTTLGILAVCFPEQTSQILKDYKDRLTSQRHQGILEFLQSSRRYIGNSDDQKLTLHPAEAEDIKNTLLTAPICRYGILRGPSGCGKSRLLRNLAENQQYVAYLSLGLTAGGVHNLVEEMAEEVGYDFDDWTQRVIQSYFFTGQASVGPIDRLAMLLDELEEAAWSLKFDPKNTEKHRLALFIDDLDSIQVQDPLCQKALSLLFSAAHKWAREDTMTIIFGCSDQFYENAIVKHVDSYFRESAKIVNVGPLDPKNAHEFLRSRIPAITPHESVLVQTAVGRRLSSLTRISEEVSKNHKTIESAIATELNAAYQNLLVVLNDTQNNLTVKESAALLKYLDSLVSSTNKIVLKSDDDALKLARELNVLKFIQPLVTQSVLNSDGAFTSESYALAYLKFRGTYSRRNEIFQLWK